MAYFPGNGLRTRRPYSSTDGGSKMACGETAVYQLFVEGGDVFGATDSGGHKARIYRRAI